MILYRPVGQAEYDLIDATGFTAYPPRLPEQPIFYPVLNERYAREICDKWNRRRADAQYTGYVTTFEIDDDYAAKFPIQTVGASYHQELWVPAEELEEFNRHIIGTIRVLPDEPNKSQSQHIKELSQKLRTIEEDRDSDSKGVTIDELNLLLSDAINAEH